MTPTERGIELQKEIEARLPEFVSQLRKSGPGEEIFLHQDAFAADYQEAEYTLLGKAIKYAGIFGKGIRIAGRNRETLQPPA